MNRLAPVRRRPPATSRDAFPGRKRLPSTALARVLPLVALAACSHHAPLPVSDGPATKVATAVAHEESLPVLYRASGTVRGSNTTVLTSKTVGYVRSVRVHAGDQVTAGQALVDLEANDVRAQVSRARAALDQSNEGKIEAEGGVSSARAAAKIAKLSYDRATQLLKDGAIPQQQFDDAEARWHAAEAQERMAEARLRSLGSSIDGARAALGEASATLGYAGIVAPFAGRILERRVDPGALATPGMPLLVIGDEGVLRVEAVVEESHADAMKVGDEAQIEIEKPSIDLASSGLRTKASKPIVGKISEIGPNVDVASRALLVKIDLPPQAGAFRPGTFARVGFRVGSVGRLVVPTSAVQSFGALDRVYVVDATHVRLRMITHGEAFGPSTEILSGLSPNERVVVDIPSGLRDGASVEVPQ